MSKGLTFMVGLQLCRMFGLKIPKVRQLEGRIYRLAIIDKIERFKFLLLINLGDKLKKYQFFRPIFVN
jgi:hypothetical protein